MKTDPTAALDEAIDNITRFAVALNKIRFKFANRTGEFPTSMKNEKGYAVDGIVIHSRDHVDDVQMMLVRALQGTQREVGLIGRALNRLGDNEKQFMSGEWDAKREAGK